MTLLILDDVIILKKSSPPKSQPKRVDLAPSADEDDQSVDSDIGEFRPAPKSTSATKASTPKLHGIQLPSSSLFSLKRSVPAAKSGIAEESQDSDIEILPPAPKSNPDGKASSAKNPDIKSPSPMPSKT